MKKVTYTKNDIINSISNDNNISYSESAVMVNMVIDSITNSLKNSLPNCRLEIRNFGIFEVNLAKPRLKARNPKTQEIVKVPSRRRIKFKPGKILSEHLKKEWKS
tara:strand:- start:146 stop:460 length:315 start_codon:yes stop_codon:yes gene_type:complete